MEGLFKALASKGYDVVSHNVLPSQLRILGRVNNDRQGVWVATMDRILAQAEKQTDWSVDLSKTYFRRGGRIVFAWRIIVQGEDVLDNLGGLTMAVSTATPEPARVTEQALVGLRASRDRLVNGKGAQNALRATTLGTPARRGI